MTIKTPERKTFIGIIVLVALVSLAFASIIFLKSSTNASEHDLNQYDICTSRNYRSVKEGMTKEDVTHIFGAPRDKRVKTSSNQYEFAQGEYEASIKEGWFYEFENTSGTISIFFNRSGHVVTTGCGAG